MHLSVPRRLSLVGLHTLRVYSPRSSDDQRLLDELQKWYEVGKGHFFRPKVAHLQTDEHVRKNIVVNSGLNFLASLLCNTASETDKFITHFAIGDDNSAAAPGDTTLGSEQFRKAISSALNDGSVANISTFLAASEANFTWEEWGHFADSDGSPDSGTMFSHHIQQLTKSAPDTVTVDSTYSFANA